MVNLQCTMASQGLCKATPHKFSVSRPPLASGYCPALKTPLFHILPLFSGYSCILTGLVETVSAHESAVLSSQHKKNKNKKTPRLCYFCNLRRKVQA